MSHYADTLRRVLEGDFHEATTQQKREASREVITACSIAAGAVAIQPVPLLDAVLISPIQIGMVQAIARVHGYSLDQKSVVEILSTFGASIVAQNVVMAAAKFVPFGGWIVTISMAYALTYAIGEVAETYFSTGRGVAPTELKEMFKSVYKEKRAQKEAEHTGDASLKDKLLQLTEAFKAGLLTEEEYIKKKEELLATF